MKKNYSLRLLLLVITIIVASCSKIDDEQTGKVDVSKPTLKNLITGTIEKGPFITGSKVTLYELDKDLRQTGKNIFKTETVNDKGEFSFDSKMELSSQFVELEINGFFYNEVTGYKSSTQITLNALADISSKDKINANVLTHLEYKRIKKLVSEGLSFSNAKKQAQHELLKIFLIEKDIKHSEDIGLTDGNDDASILLAISSLLLYDKLEADFSEFISKMGNDFANDGKISNEEIKNRIYYAQTNMDAVNVMNNMKSYYLNEHDADIVVNNIRKYIDGNGDGVLDEEDENLNNGSTPLDSIVQDNFWENEEHFIEYINKVDIDLSQFLKNAIVLYAVRTNQIEYEIDLSPHSSNINSLFSSAYRIIRQLNFLLESIREDIVPDTYNYYISKAKTLRALTYLNMTQFWGDVQFVTRVLNLGDNDMYMPRTPTDEIYKTLLEDLDYSVQHLPNEKSDSIPNITKDLAYTLKGIINLEQKDYSASANNLMEVIDSSKSIYLGDDVYSDYNNDEVIYSIKLEEYNSYSTFDEYIRKGNIHPIYRYTGVLLHYAEAMVGLGNRAEAIKILNEIRQSSGSKPLVEPVDNIKKELAHLWLEHIGADFGYFDLLKRLDLAIELLDIEGYQQLYPIPFQELLKNPNIVQNPGYY